MQMEEQGLYLVFCVSMRAFQVSANQVTHRVRARPRHAGNETRWRIECELDETSGHLVGVHGLECDAGQNGNYR